MISSAASQAAERQDMQESVRPTFVWINCIDIVILTAVIINISHTL